MVSPSPILMVRNKWKTWHQGPYLHTFSTACQFFSLSVCLLIPCLSVCLSLSPQCLLACMPVCLLITVSLLVCLSACLSPCLPACLHTSLPVPLPISLPDQGDRILISLECLQSPVAEDILLHKNWNNWSGKKYILL